MEIQFVSSPTELQSYLDNNENLIVYFTASWCGPCKAIAPLMNQLYLEFSSSLEIIKVDLDSQKQIAAKYKISAVPSFLFFSKKQEIERVQGADVNGIRKAIDNLLKLNPTWVRSSTSSSGSGSSSLGSIDEFKPFIPKGYTILNKCIFYGEFESLNLIKQKGEELTSFIRLQNDACVMSDTDNQILVHIPFTNLTKVYSILIESKLNEQAAEEEQKPNLVKAWINKNRIMSFEDAEITTPLHNEELKEDSWNNNICEIKFKYVRFQKVSSLDLLIQGDDEDAHTVLNKLVIVGIDGESKNQGKLAKLEDE